MSSSNNQISPLIALSTAIVVALQSAFGANNVPNIPDTTVNRAAIVHLGQALHQLLNQLSSAPGGQYLVTLQGQAAASAAQNPPASTNGNQGPGSTATPSQVTGGSPSTPTSATATTASITSASTNAPATGTASTSSALHMTSTSSASPTQSTLSNISANPLSNNFDYTRWWNRERQIENLGMTQEEWDEC